MMGIAAEFRKKNVNGLNSHAAPFADAIRDMHRMESLSRMDTGIHRLHPVTKLIATVAFLVAALSFERHAVGRLLPLFLYPIVIAAMADLPWKPFLKRLLAVEPLIVGIGILNPLFDTVTITIGDVTFARGWLTFLSIVLKTSLSVLAALQLIACTGMERILSGMSLLGMPRVFVMQISLTYRYITVLSEETGRIMTARSLRSSGKKGMRAAAWGSLAGMLLLRSFERAHRIHQVMRLRGYNGYVPLPPGTRPGWRDALYLAGWLSWFALSRWVDLPLLLGRLATGIAGR
jgi:cobalt/nickel transport system permease protein